MGDEEISEVLRMFCAHGFDPRFRGDACFFRAQHRRSAMGVVGAYVVALVAHHALKAHPDIGLHVFKHMTDVNGAVGVRQGAGNE